MAEELITWAESETISKDLIAKAQDFNEDMLNIFANMQGLYFLCYTGTELGGTLWKAPAPAIIYIGRAGHDSARHWRNNTGVSTVRRFLAAMLANTLQLTSIPSSDDINDTDRYTNYALTEESEEKLSQWMKDNIKVAFWEMDAAKIEPSYHALINFNTPKLNFQDNPNNTFGQQIKSYRKLLIDMATSYDLGKIE